MGSIGRLSTKGTVLLLCDMQEKFRPTIFQFTNIVSNAARVLQVSPSLSDSADVARFLLQLVKYYNVLRIKKAIISLTLLPQACRTLGIPPIVTEQYPKGLGPTVPELGASDLKPHAKTKFSMLTEEVQSELKILGEPKKAILCGIEAQACIAVCYCPVSSNNRNRSVSFSAIQQEL